MKHIVLVFLISTLHIAAFSQAKGRITPEQYIQKYKEIAIREMKRSGIPASITIAQGMLESDNGNSRLARNANNHFGIKCHDWKGKGLYQDDDKNNECFRTYKNADESYVDHSDFLMSKQRYSSLFKYKTTDYKNWAKGLKKAGYATNPSYAEKLIKIIEENNLHYFDSDVTASQRPASHYKASRNRKNDPEFTININARPIFQRNNVDYIVAKKGDSFSKIAIEMDLLSWELYKYNDLTKDSSIREGQILYLQPKRRKAALGSDTHTLQKNETLYSVSQQYAVKMKNLIKYNLIADSSTLKPGEVLNLRKRKKF